MHDKLTSLKPQTRNANKHTARGLGALEKSIQADGWIGAITVAADGETFDGSARIEVGAAAGFDDAIVVRSDGSRPVVHIREDIATADDPRAKRLGVAANRVGQLDLAWDASVLAELADTGVALDGLYTDKELEQLFASLSLDMAGGEPDAAEPPDYSMGELPASYVRMVQLFLTTETQPEFLRLVQALRGRFGVETITDTVFEAVKYAYRALDNQAA